MNFSLKQKNCSIWNIVFYSAFSLSVLALILSILYKTSWNPRKQVIQEYNNFAQQWDITYMDQYKEAGLSFYVNDVNKQVITRKTVSDQYWPLYDSCMKVKDSSDSCMQPKQYYYAITNIKQSDSNLYILKGGNNTNIIFSDVIPPNRTTIFSPISMSCENNINECISTCKTMKGTWRDTYCEVYEYLSSVCIRIKYNDNKWIVDTDDVAHSGCYYENGYWSSYMYSLTKYTTFEFDIRSVNDPAVMSSKLTYGCSDSHDKFFECASFKSQSSMQFTTYIIVLSCLVLVILSIISLIQCCCKCNHKDSPNNSLTTIIS